LTNLPARLNWNVCLWLERLPEGSTNGNTSCDCHSRTSSDECEILLGCVRLAAGQKDFIFDDPGTYHRRYGDETGQLGSILTFLPWPGAPREQHNMQSW
jgi:hypothetical protein